MACTGGAIGGELGQAREGGDGWRDSRHPVGVLLKELLKAEATSWPEAKPKA